MYEKSQLKIENCLIYAANQLQETCFEKNPFEVLRHATIAGKGANNFNEIDVGEVSDLLFLIPVGSKNIFFHKKKNRIFKASTVDLPLIFKNNPIHPFNARFH